MVDFGRLLIEDKRDKQVEQYILHAAGHQILAGAWDYLDDCLRKEEFWPPEIDEAMLLIEDLIKKINTEKKVLLTEAEKPIEVRA